MPALAEPPSLEGAPTPVPDLSGSPTPSVGPNSDGSLPVAPATLTSPTGPAGSGKADAPAPPASDGFNVLRTAHEEASRSRYANTGDPATNDRGRYGISDLEGLGYKFAPIPSNLDPNNPADRQQLASLYAQRLTTYDNARTQEELENPSGFSGDPNAPKDKYAQSQANALRSLQAKAAEADLSLAGSATASLRRGVWKSFTNAFAEPSTSVSDTVQQEAANEKHPITSGAAYGTGRALSPESLATIAATGGAVNPLIEGAGVGGKVLAGAVAGGAYGASAQTAQQNLEGEQATPLRNIALGAAGGAAGTLAGQATNRIAQGIANPALRAAAKFTGGAAGAAGVNAGVGAAGTLAEGGKPTVQQAIRDALAGVAQHAAVGGPEALHGEPTGVKSDDQIETNQAEAEPGKVGTTEQPVANQPAPSQQESAQSPVAVERPVGAVGLPVDKPNLEGAPTEAQPPNEQTAIPIQRGEAPSNFAQEDALRTATKGLDRTAPFQSLEGAPTPKPIGESNIREIAAPETVAQQKSPAPAEQATGQTPSVGASKAEADGEGTGKAESKQPPEPKSFGPGAAGENDIGQRGLSEGPPGPLQVGQIAKAAGINSKKLGVAALGEIRHLRERFSPVEAKYGSEITKDFIKTVAAPSAESRTIVSDFVKRAFGDAPDPEKAFQDWTDLGRYYRLRDLQQRMPGKNVGGGLPPLQMQDQIIQHPNGTTTTIRGVTSLENDPINQNATALYNKGIAPRITDIRQRNGMIMNSGASNPAKFPYFLNLPGEYDGAQGTDTSVNPSKAFNKAATGNSQLLMDPKESLEAAVRGHIATDYKQNLVKNLKANFSVPQSNVVQQGKGFTANFHGQPTEVQPVDLAPNGSPAPDIHYLPAQLAHEYNNIRQDRGVHDTLFDKAIQAGTKAATIAAFAPHAARVISHVAARDAQSGRSVTGLLPSWLGSNEAAASRMIDMAKTPWGKTVQLLIDRTGSDKGAGYDVKPGQTRIQQLLAKPHDILFDPDHGVDPMGRRVIGDAHLRILFGNDAVNSLEKSVNSGHSSFADAADNLEKQMSPKDFVGFGRKINSTLGFANKQTRSDLLNWASRIFPFTSSESGMIPREVSKVANVDPVGLGNAVKAGQWKQAALRLGGALATGAVGTYLASNALNYANTKAQTGTGRFMSDNDDGHKLDIWVAPKWHVSNLDPTFARATRITGIKGYANGDNLVRSAGLEALNEPLSMLAKTLQVAVTAATAMNGGAKSLHLVHDDKTGDVKLQPTTIAQSIGVPFAGNTVKEAQEGRPVGPGIIQDAAKATTGLSLTHDNQDPKSPTAKLVQKLGYQGNGVPPTPEQKAKSDMHKKAAQLIRDGKIDDAIGLLKDAPKSERTAVVERAKQPDDFAYEISRLSKDNARQVLKAMSPAERIKYRDVLVKKLGEN